MNKKFSIIIFSSPMTVEKKTENNTIATEKREKERKKCIYIGP